MDLEGTKEQKRGRRNFEKDFKLGAVKMVLEGNKSIREVAEDLGISQHTLTHWKKIYLTEKVNVFPGKGYQNPEDSEMISIKKENAILREERDILKKAVSFFAKHQK